MALLKDGFVQSLRVTDKYIEYDNPFKGFVHFYRNEQSVTDKYIEYDNHANQYSMFLFN